MFANTFSRRLIWNFVFILIFLILYISVFYPLYISSEIIIPFAVNPFNICESYPDAWTNIKFLYVVISLIATLIEVNLIYNSLFTKEKIAKHKYENVNLRAITFN